MIWRILLHRLRKHAMLHLVVPLVIGLVIESLIEALIAGVKDLEGYKWGSLTSWVYFYFHSGNFDIYRPLILFAGVFGTYVLIMAHLIKRETSFREGFSSLAVLEKTLDNAQSYFGVSVIPIEEWFEPSMQVYLAKLFNRKLAPDDFEHERTLIFFSDGERRRAKIPLMDEYYYGRCLAHMHKDCGIPLSYLKRKDVFKILDRLSDEDKAVLCCYPRWTGWSPFRVFRGIPLRYLRRRITNLDIAVVEKMNGEKLVLRVTKHGTDVQIKQKIKGEHAQPYIKFLEEIRNEIYTDGEEELDSEHDFVKLYYPHFGSKKVHSSVPPELNAKPPGASGNGGDESSAQVESEASARIGSGIVEESYAGAAEQESAYHAVTMLPHDSPAGVEPSKLNKKN